MKHLRCQHALVSISRQQALARIHRHQPAKLIGVAAVYQRYDFARERAVALDAWAVHILGFETSNVVPLRTARSQRRYKIAAADKGTATRNDGPPPALRRDHLGGRQRRRERCLTPIRYR